MITIKDCEEHLKIAGSAVKVSGWCIKTYAKLHSKQDNLHMHGVMDKGVYQTRATSIIEEINNYPENISLIFIDGREKYEIDCTDEITCPLCGHVHSDSWEWSPSGPVDCHFCDQEFDYEKDISISYSSSIIR